MFFLVAFEQYFCFSDVKRCYYESQEKVCARPQEVEHFLFIDVLCRKSAPDKSVDWLLEDRQIDDIARNSYLNTFLDAR